MNKSWEGYHKNDFDPEGNPQLGNTPSKFIETRTYKPHECKISGKTIYPFQKAWCKTYYHYYTGRPAFEEWVCKEEMLFSKIRGEKL